MPESTLLHELVSRAADRRGPATALTQGSASLGYDELDTAVSAFASGLLV